MNEMTRMTVQPVSPQPETRGLNFFHADPFLKAVLTLYLGDEERRHMEPYFARLGELIGDDLDVLADEADKNPPVLNACDRQGAARQSLTKHPSYVELERIAYGDFALAAMHHRSALGWSEPLSSVTKYTFIYLFAQSEFGLLCPVNMTDSLTRTIRHYASPELLDRFLPGLLEEDPGRLTQGAMFMTEQFAGSDVGATQTRAERDGDHWRLYGEKWFCSNVDAGLALVMARPEGGGDGTRGLGLFLMPRELDDGTPNHYRIVRLKDKLGTRSMASGEIVLEGAVAYLVGELSQGFKQMTEMVNQSRLANAVRSAGMMRRSLHEAMAVACGRTAFGKRLIDLPLARRQLVKMAVVAEQGLSMVFFTGECLDKTDGGCPEARKLRRILTPLVKFRTCRDARKVAGDAMEMRGGCGYIEEWIESRLVRESHLGSIWEGTSSITALDVIRASGKERAHEQLAKVIEPMISAAPDDLAGALTERLEKVMSLVNRVADARGSQDALARQAASGLYNVTSAALLCDEGVRLKDDLRFDFARLVLTHRLNGNDPLQPETAEDAKRADRIIDALVAARSAV